MAPPSVSESPFFPQRADQCEVMRVTMRYAGVILDTLDRADVSVCVYVFFCLTAVWLYKQWSCFLYRSFCFPINTHVTLIFAICVNGFVCNGSIFHEKNSNRMRTFVFCYYGCDFSFLLNHDLCSLKMVLHMYKILILVYRHFYFFCSFHRTILDIWPCSVCLFCVVFGCLICYYAKGILDRALSGKERNITCTIRIRGAATQYWLAQLNFPIELRVTLRMFRCTPSYFFLTCTYGLTAIINTL